MSKTPTKKPKSNSRTSTPKQMREASNGSNRSPTSLKLQSPHTTMHFEDMTQSAPHTDSAILGNGKKVSNRHTSPHKAILELVPEAPNSVSPNPNMNWKPKKWTGSIESHSATISSMPPSSKESNNHEPVESRISPQSESSKSENRNSNYDWEFWGAFLQDYDSMLEKEPDRVKENVRKNVPDMFRGDIWICIAQANDPLLKEKYQQLLEYISPFEKLIKRDLFRTFPKHPFFRKGERGVKSLFHLMKAYSLYDIEVGYCQGLSFVAGSILLNVQEEGEAFSLLVKLLEDYDLRQLYLPSLEGLHLFIFQLDNLIKIRMPEIHNHFSKEGINSPMYATEWFMTLFAYRLPLDLVFRIFDLIFAEGVSILLNVALALLSKAREKILALEFDKIIEYLKLGIFKDKTGSLSNLIDTALQIDISTAELEKFAVQFEIHQPTTPAFDEIETLRLENRQLTQRVHALEVEGEALRHEHYELTNALLQTKVELAHVQESNSNILKQLSSLKKSKSTQKSSPRNSDVSALHELNDILNLQLKELQGELLTTKDSLSESRLTCERLKKELEATKNRPITP